MEAGDPELFVEEEQFDPSIDGIAFLTGGSLVELFTALVEREVLATAVCDGFDFTDEFAE